MVFLRSLLGKEKPMSYFRVSGIQNVNFKFKKEGMISHRLGNPNDDVRRPITIKAQDAN